MTDGERAERFATARARLRELDALRRIAAAAFEAYTELGRALLALTPPSCVMLDERTVEWIEFVAHQDTEGRVYVTDRRLDASHHRDLPAAVAWQAKRANDHMADLARAVCERTWDANLAYGNAHRALSAALESLVGPAVWKRYELPTPAVVMLDGRAWVRTLAAHGQWEEGVVVTDAPNERNAWR